MNPRMAQLSYNFLQDTSKLVRWRKQMWEKPRHLFLIKQLAQQLSASTRVEWTAQSPALQRAGPWCTCSRSSLSQRMALGNAWAHQMASRLLLWLIGFAGSFGTCSLASSKPPTLSSSRGTWPQHSCNHLSCGPQPLLLRSHLVLHINHKVF